MCRKARQPLGVKLQHTGVCAGTQPLPKVNEGGGRWLQKMEDKMEVNPAAVSGQALGAHSSPDPADPRF